MKITRNTYEENILLRKENKESDVYNKRLSKENIKLKSTIERLKLFISDL